MKFFKFIAPMLAFVLAIGMSFAMNSSNESVAADEAIIYQGEPIEVNVGCMGEQFNCTVQLVDDNNNPIPGEIYQVYGADAQGNHTVLLKSESDEPFKVRLSSLGN